MGTHEAQASYLETQMSRSIIGGKKTADVKARTSDELKFALQRRCCELGMTESEFIDRLLALSLFGEEHVLSVERAKTKGVAGLCPPTLIDGARR